MAADPLVQRTAPLVSFCFDLCYSTYSSSWRCFNTVKHRSNLRHPSFPGSNLTALGLSCFLFILLTPSHRSSLTVSRAHLWLHPLYSQCSQQLTSSEAVGHFFYPVATRGTSENRNKILLAVSLLRSETWHVESQIFSSRTAAKPAVFFKMMNFNCSLLPAAALNLLLAQSSIFTLLKFKCYLMFSVYFLNWPRFGQKMTSARCYYANGKQRWEDDFFFHLSIPVIWST